MNKNKFLFWGRSESAPPAPSALAILSENYKNKKAIEIVPNKYSPKKTKTSGFATVDKEKGM